MLIPKINPNHRRRVPKRGKRNKFPGWLKSEIYERDNGKCQQCGGRGQQVHHVKFRSASGRGVKTNGVLLCIMCHREVHDNYDLALEWQARFIERYGEDYYKDQWD